MSDGFSADWLRQREPLDLAARSPTLAQGFRAALAQTGRPRWRLIDLAAGSGANFRALAPVLEADQDWLLIDHDPLLLAAQRSEIAHWSQRQGWSCQHQDGALSINTGQAHWQVRGQRLDLARDLGAIDLSVCDGLVTTAFLDLVSAAWLDQLCALLTQTLRPLLATLSVDGRRIWQPARPADDFIAKSFLAHQGGDKGFGPSLGVQATPHLAASLAHQGYRVSTDASDWRIGPDQPALLQALAREAFEVAAATDPSNATTAAVWQAQRLGDLQQSRLSLTVGHLDLLALP